MVPTGRGSSSRDRQRRLLTHTHWALYRLTPFHTYLTLTLTDWLTDWLLAAPLPNHPSLQLALSLSFFLLPHTPPLSPTSPSPSVLILPTHASLHSPIPLVCALCLSGFPYSSSSSLSPLQTWHKAGITSNITLTLVSAVPLPLQRLSMASLSLSSSTLKVYLMWVHHLSAANLLLIKCLHFTNSHQLAPWWAFEVLLCNSLCRAIICGSSSMTKLLSKYNHSWRWD